MCASALLEAQLGPITRVPPFPEALRQYLELTPQQVATITQLNGSFSQFQSEKARRAAQVQIEIAQETGKPTLDAMALGMRYLELEAIRREIRSQQQKTYNDVQNALTAPQKVKVQALIEAMRLQSLTCEAQSQNIIGSMIPGNRIPSNIISSGQQGFASFLLGGVISPVPLVPSCAPGLIRGDFLPVPIAPPTQP